MYGAEEIRRAFVRARGLAALRGVFDDGTGRDFLALLGLLSEKRAEPSSMVETFARLWGMLADDPEPLLPDAWRSYLVGRVLEGEHPFGLAAERGETGSSLVEQARRDLATLRTLFDLDGETLIRAVERAVPETLGLWVPPVHPVPDHDDASPRQVLANKLAATDDWNGLVGALAEHYSRHGAGAFGRYRAFRWEGGRLRVVPRPDPARLSTLVGYEREREPLIRNTVRLLAGLPSHHALLYGPPGTGKSSTVKAIAAEYAGSGLRLVEVAKEDLRELPRVLEALRGRGPRFILFVDDLSFEEEEIEYKALKALLEGSVEEPPPNVRVYATSNRRNLIRERFSEREEGGTGDDVHGRDTMQEKLSLAARFGLRLTFPSPNQRRYLEIVAGLAGERGMEVPPDELRERALLWERWHVGRSGRTARQFVDELEAGLAEDPGSSP